MPSSGGGSLYCYICQKSFATASALRMHCQSSKAHREETSGRFLASRPFSEYGKDWVIDSYLAPSPPASSTDKSNVLSTNKGSMCKLCDRQFVNKSALWKHKRDSPKHRTPPKASRGISSNIVEAPASSLNRKGEISTAPEVQASSISAKENDKVEKPLANLNNQPCPLPLLHRGLHAPSTSFSKGDPDIEIGLSSALAALHTASDSSVVPGLPPVFGADINKAKTNNLVASVTMDTPERGTNPANYELVVHKVPAPWSAIPLSERGVVLNALQAQCHPIECLVAERYWTQTPSPVDIDMTRQCNGCGCKKLS